MPSEMFSIRMDKTKLDMLRQLANEQGLPVSDIIRNLVDDYLSKCESEEDELERIARLVAQVMKRSMGEIKDSLFEGINVNA